MEGIKEWWSPIFFLSSHRTSCLLLLFSPPHVLLLSVRVTKSGGLTPDKIGHREQEPEEWVRERKMKRNNKAIISFWLTSIQLSSPPPPHVTPFVRSLFPTYIFSLDSSDCLLPCYLSLSILSAFFSFPWSPHLPCFAFLYLAFHLTLPYSVWFYFSPLDAWFGCFLSLCDLLLVVLIVAPPFFTLTT